MKLVHCAREKKWLVKCICLHTPGGYSRLLSAVSETYCNKKSELILMSSANFWTCPSSTRNRLEKSIISNIVEEEWVLQFLRLILDGDDFWLRLQLESLIEVATRSCRTYPMWDTTVLGIFWRVRVILLCQLVHLDTLLLGPTNLELRFTIDLVSEKMIVSSFVMIFLSVNTWLHGTLSLYFRCVVSSIMVTSFLDHLVRDRERVSCHSLLNFLLDSLSTKKCPQMQ